MATVNTSIWGMKITYKWYIAKKIKKGSKRMKKKNVILLAVCSLLVVFFAYVVFRDIFLSDTVRVFLDGTYLDEQRLLDDSDVVIVGTVISAPNTLAYHKADFQTFEVEVIKSLNNVEVKETISIIQTYFGKGANEDFIPLEKGNTYILFLYTDDSGEGPNAKNEYYWICGVSFGQVDLGKIDAKAVDKATAIKRNKLQNELVSSQSSIIFSVEELTKYYEEKNNTANNE